MLSSSVGVTSGIVIVAFLSFQTSNSDLTCTTNRAPLLFYFPKNHSLRELSYYSPHLTQAPSKSPVSPYFSDPMDYLNFRRGFEHCDAPGHTKLFAVGSNVCIKACSR